MNETFTWIGIAFCISQSAMFSGLNLAVFSVGRLRLQVAARHGDAQAIKVLRLRRDANFILATILWGNVGVNVLLTLLSNSVLAGVAAFTFSTFVITILGEIMPQAYFSRNALRMASVLAPALRFYQYLFYPVTRPTAWLLDRWLGPEATPYMREDHLREMIRQHIRPGEGGVDALEGIGAMNFLELDDHLVGHEGEIIAPDSILRLPCRDGHPVFPEVSADIRDPFLRELHKSEKAWVVLTDLDDNPCVVLDAEGALCAALFGKHPMNWYHYCHRPVMVTDPETPLGDVIGQLRVQPEHPSDDVIDFDVILLWGEKQKRIITGSDLLGRLLRGIVKLDRAPRRTGPGT
jgi:hypothetical protein